MIVATFVGGPKDGDEIALKDARPLRIPIRPAFSCIEPDITQHPSIRYIELKPQLTANGWRLYWTERPC